MKRVIPLIIAAMFGIAACGGNRSPKEIPHTIPGQRGCMTPSGVCEKPKPITKRTASRVPHSFPDSWEGDGCTQYHGFQVIRFSYGNHFYDHQVYCNTARLRAWHVRFDVYVYITGNGCTREALYAAREFHAVGGGAAAVIDDEEISGVNRAYSECFEHTVESNLHVPSLPYTGCYSGVSFRRAWVPSYGAAPHCGPRWAWQYTENGVCGEPWAGDCSVNEGLETVHPAHPRPPCGTSCRRKIRTRLAKLDRESWELGRRFMGWGCQREVNHHHRLGPKCHATGQRLRAINHEIGVLQRKLRHA